MVERGLFKPDSGKRKQACKKGNGNSILKKNSIIFPRFLMHSKTCRGMDRQRFYLDTGIWRDYFEDRRDNMRPLGEFAFQFLSRATQQNAVFIVSNLVTKELLKYYSPERVHQLFLPFKTNIKSIESTYAQHKEAARAVPFRMESHYEDILHVILARDTQSILVTRDKGFESLKDIAKSARPEEIIFD